MKAKSLLHEMTQKFPQTEFWNDSCGVESLKRAIAQGATGATSNPVIVLGVIEEDKERWARICRAFIDEFPDKDEEFIAWELIEHAVGLGADLLLPVFKESGGQRGRLSVQVNPRNYRNAEAMIAQARDLDLIRGNIAIKIPATGAGIEAIQYLTGIGITTNATVSYSVSQAIAVAEAIEHGLAHAENMGRDISGITPWVTIMVGRIEDHLREERERLCLTKLVPDGMLEVAGEAIFKKAYQIFQERGYRAKLLSAAMRGTRHWRPFIGGDCVITIPPSWQDKFNDTHTLPKYLIDEPARSMHIEYLKEYFVDFRRAWRTNGMSVQEFEQFGATKKTLHQFIGGYEDLLKFVRNVMLPLP